MATTTFYWVPFGVGIDLTAVSGTVTRISATQFKVVITASWRGKYSSTNYGMKVVSGGSTIYIPAYNGSNHREGSGTLTGTYSISGNGSQTKSISVTFTNYKTDVSTNGSASKTLTLSVTVPAWTSYTISYDANGGTGAPSSQTKYKDQALTLSSTKPTRAGHTFQGWGTSASDTTVDYAAGASYTSNASATLYAIWKANTYAVKYDANGGTGAPANQTKTYGVNLTLSKTVPSKEFHNFLGWATSASSTTVLYKAGDTYTANAAITLYAVWELAYVKPRVNVVELYREGADGLPNDNSTYIFMCIEVESDYPCTSGTVMWKKSTDSDWVNNREIGCDGTTDKAKFDIYIGNLDPLATDALSTDNTYDVCITVTDIETTTITLTLPAAFFPIDVLKEGKGVSFGKAAELEGVAEFEFTGKFNKDLEVAGDAKFGKNVYGTVYGLAELESIPADADLNLYTEPGCYAIRSNAVAETLFNVPVLLAGRLFVSLSLGLSESDAGYVYLEQRFVPYRSSCPAYTRNIEKDGFDAEYIYGEWCKEIKQYPTLPNGTNFNNIKEVGQYPIASVGSSGYINCPITSGTGLLEVCTAGPEGQISQSVKFCSKVNPIQYERFYYQEAWGEWHEVGGYKSILSAGLSNDTTLGVVNAYTKVPLGRSIASKGGGLTLSSGGIQIGTGIKHVLASGQLKIHTGSTTGNRHLKINKDSGGTTSCITWNHEYVRNASDTLTVSFAPILVPVEEGDILYITFYTPDAADYNYMGSSAGGWQTYLTVESI